MRHLLTGLLLAATAAAQPTDQDPEIWWDRGPGDPPPLERGKTGYFHIRGLTSHANTAMTITLWNGEHGPGRIDDSFQVEVNGDGDADGGWFVPAMGWDKLCVTNWMPPMMVELT